MTDRRWILAAVAIGFAARIAFATGYWVGKPLTHDEREYLELAANVAAGRGFTYDPTPLGSVDPERFGRAPMYPLFLAAVLKVAGDARPAREHRSTPTAVKFAQAAVGAVGVWLIARLAWRAAGSRAAVAAALVAAVYPPLVWMPAYVLSETLFSTLALASALALHLGTCRGDMSGGHVGRHVPGDMFGGQVWGTAGAGVLAGLAALTRPVMLFFVAGVLAWGLLDRKIAVAVVFLAAALTVIAPWTMRNARVYGRLVPIASEGGITFWTGNHPLSPGEGDMAANPALKRANLELRQNHAGLSPEELEPIYYREAVAAIARHPTWWLGLVARKFFYLWVPIGPSYRLHSGRYYGATLISYGLLLALAIYAWSRARPREPRSLWVLAGSSVAAALVFMPQERFRIPIIDPALIVCASTLATLSATRRPPG